MLHDASFPFLISGLVSVLIGSLALIGSSSPFLTVAHILLPLVLIAIGLRGVMRIFRRPA